MDETVQSENATGLDLDQLERSKRLIIGLIFDVGLNYWVDLFGRLIFDAGLNY